MERTEYIAHPEEHCHNSKTRKIQIFRDRKSHCSGRCNRIKRTTLLPSSSHFRKYICDAIPLGIHGLRHTSCGLNSKWVFFLSCDTVLLGLRNIKLYATVQSESIQFQYPNQNRLKKLPSFSEPNFRSLHSKYCYWLRFIRITPSDMFSSQNRVLSFLAEHSDNQLLISSCLEVRVEKLGSVWNDLYCVVNTKFQAKYGGLNILLTVHHSISV
jgi:hypothetical protein